MLLGKLAWEWAWCMAEDGGRAQTVRHFGLVGNNGPAVAVAAVANDNVYMACRRLTVS